MASRRPGTPRHSEKGRAEEVAGVRGSIGVSGRIPRAVDPMRHWPGSEILK